MESDLPCVIADDVIDHLCKVDSTLQSFCNQKFKYGTAGFRYKAVVLDKIAFRSAIVTCLLSMSKQALPYGIMITASHNKCEDNGIKIAGDRGEMLLQSEEHYYEDIVNAINLKDTIISICNQLHIKQVKCAVVLGIDTRDSCTKLSSLMLQVFDIIKTCEYKFYGIITTPSLHFLTFLSQMKYKQKGTLVKEDFPSDKEYWTYFTNAFNNYNSFYRTYFTNVNDSSSSLSLKKYESTLTIDCSNGIASHIKDNIANAINSSELSVSFINTDEHNTSKLNEGCGAEYVHKEHKYPENQNTSTIKNLSFDGDVDRIIYYVYSSQLPKLIDGDRLIVLYSTMLNFFLSKLSSNLYNTFLSKIKIGIITTAYANGELMNYVKTNLKGLELILAKTGVKYLHEQARKFDIAVYFEANGHGTIYCDEHLQEKFEKLNCFVESSKDSQVLELMQHYLSMFNLTVGDAVSSLFATESSLRTLNMSIHDVYTMYKELPSRNAKVCVKDKNKFIPNDNETRLIQPIAVQNEIDALVSQVNKGRCFIRPSGTEDVVRIYAEAANENDVECIINKMILILKEY